MILCQQTSPIECRINLESITKLTPNEPAIYLPKYICSTREGNIFSSVRLTVICRVGGSLVVVRSYALDVNL